MKIAPIVLEGETVKLAPLKLNYLDRLYEAANDESLWFWTVNVIKSKDDLRRYVETALREFESKISLPFVIKEKSTDKIIGSTRFGNIDIKNRKAEIGSETFNAHPRF
jgi:N-acetyltransferase